MVSRQGPHSAAGGGSPGARGDGSTEVEPEATAPHPPIGGGRAYLVIREGARTGVRELGDGEAITLGRSPEADVVVEDARVSRRHTRLERRGELVLVSDLGSRNGTRINGEVFHGRDHAIGGGDVVGVGALEVVVAVARPSAVIEVPDPGEEPAPSTPGGFIVADAAMVKVFEVVRRLAMAPTSVLIVGETGVGKEVVAEQLHRASPRRDRPFVRLNCASLPDSLLESELFGHEKGAFTGADRRKVGYLEAADGGTLLLDEIGELPLPMQAKLLRALETHCVVRIGGTQENTVDVRVVCATHRDVEAEVAAGRFRQDLYYRISAFCLRVPPLRKRPTEIVLLAELFARRFAARMGTAPPRFERRALDALLAYPWPGNVRELRNAVEHALVLADGPVLALEHLPEAVAGKAAPAAPERPADGIVDRVAELERRSVEQALAAANGNRTAAALALGISRRALIYKLDKYGIK